MSGHWICGRCGYDGEHADYCVYLRPSAEQWKGHRTKEEMQKIKAEAVALTSTHLDSGAK